MIPRKHHKILVQGITGKQGTFWTSAMQEYGSRIVGGVNPKRAGSEHLGVPVFASAREAAKAETVRHLGHVHSADDGEGGSHRRV